MSTTRRKKGAASKLVEKDALATDFATLVDAVRRMHEECAALVNRAVNTTLTMRNWGIGGHIQRYELHGEDRAAYGERLLDRLAERLASLGVPSCDRRRLYAYRQFFLAYPQLQDVVSQALSSYPEIVRSVTAQSPERQEPGTVATVRPTTAQLLCTQKDHVLVEYATANVDNRLFVSKYQLELPRKDELERFLLAKRDELTHGQEETP